MKFVKVIILYVFLLNYLFPVTGNNLNIWIMDGNPYYEILEKQCYRYESKNKIKIHIKNLNISELRSSFITAAKQNGGPDILFGVNDWIGEFVSKEVIVPLDNYYAKKKLLNDFFSVCYESVTYSGKIYAIPVILESLILVYNKEIIDKPPATDKELIDLALKHTSLENGRYGLTFNFNTPYYVIPFIYGFGGFIFNEDNLPGINNKGTKDAINYIYDLRNKYKVVPSPVTDNIMYSLFSERKTTMIIVGAWAIDTLLNIKKENNIDFGLATLPKVSSTGLYMKPLLGIKSFMISNNSKNIEEAVSLIKFLTNVDSSEEILEKSLLLAANKDAYKKIPEDKKVIIENFIKQFDFCIPMPNSDNMIEYWQVLSVVLNKTLNSEKFTETYFEEGQRQLLEMIK